MYEIREARPDETAAIFVVHAAIASAAADRMLQWTQSLEERLETGGRAWVVAHGRRLAGYAAADPIPGLPGLYDLTGGIVPARRRRGLGTRLLRHVQTTAGAGIRQLSCRVESLESETAAFLLRRDFYEEHEECALELPPTSPLPPIPNEPRSELLILPQERAVSEFRRLYDDSFVDTPWSQPYTEAEVAAALVRPDDLLFLAVDGRPIGVVWHELLPNGRGRIEPIGIARDYQGQGYGRRLLLAALHRLRDNGADTIEIGLWRNNAVAMHLYKGLGFLEAGQWYYLAYDSVTTGDDAGLKAT